jgi:dTDP-4-dehydrorhamnose reductase
VFSGSRGGYNEKDPHDPCDVYGKTKSLGEIPSPAAMHLRCSIIGPELGRGSLFFEWARKQPIGARVPGFVDHFWNGLSSTTFGLIVAGILKFDSFRPGVHHLVPRDYVTKDQLVRLVFKHLGRVDVEVIATETEFPTNRILSTQYEDENSSFFEAAGYSESPTIAQMVEEMCSELPN